MNMALRSTALASAGCVLLLGLLLGLLRKLPDADDFEAVSKKVEEQGWDAAGEVRRHGKIRIHGLSEYSKRPDLTRAGTSITPSYRLGLGLSARLSYRFGLGSGLGLALSLTLSLTFYP